MATTIFSDFDYAHDLKTHRLLTGFLGFMDSTPALWMNKQQGDIASRVYATKFSAIYTATEEAQSLRYMLCCLGCNVLNDFCFPTAVFGHNLSVILNSQNPAVELSKKHVKQLGVDQDTQCFIKKININNFFVIGKPLRIFL